MPRIRNLLSQSSSTSTSQKASARVKCLASTAARIIRTGGIDKAFKMDLQGFIKTNDGALIMTDYRDMAGRIRSAEDMS